MASEITLVRHGQTDWNITGQHTGRSDLPLNALGRAQSANVARLLSSASFSRVLTSPLLRARQTCELAGFGARAEPWDELMEWDYGAWEGRTKQQISDEYPGWDMWKSGAPSGESVEAMSARVDRALERLREVEGSALVFAHGHLLRCLAARYIGAPITLGRGLALGNCAVSALGYEGTVPQIKFWNQTI